ncbi:MULTISPECIES: hypothetical protein [unclassified Mesorhizobium]|uniref:hypothetical protein n=1 Tax=unclassified Mesorhizobium TaxID=325217 RepID=UPI0011265DFA|nr:MULTISPECIES: hypothetical protein [unclassified Mesorhizobium]MCA0025463.1 hypothetical protein [Mesorhizobium sp. B263B1A]TPJ97148.1 hypothetical protein FJ489_11970 [Mesorhizobium sp. B2-5-12]TPK27185.1 hypothetical protein FJ562_08055 [Mesorhizobium sp. B2-5-6]
MNWQPIATAPKDGTRVLVWAEAEGVMTFAEWGPINDIFGVPKHTGWQCECTPDQEGHFVDGIAPTHWAPEPAPPTDLSSGQSADIADAVKIVQEILESEIDLAKPDNLPYLETQVRSIAKEVVKAVILRCFQREVEDPTKQGCEIEITH